MLYLVKKQPKSNKTNNNNDNDKYEFQYPYKKYKLQHITINGMPTFIDFENYQDILEMEESIKDNSNHFSISKPYVDKIMDKYEATQTQTQTPTPAPAQTQAQEPTPTPIPPPEPEPTLKPTPPNIVESHIVETDF
jgi:outer membrane autotransporter protein